MLMGNAIGQRAVAATFSSRYLRSLTPFIAIAAMATSFIAGAVILSFEKSRPSRMTVLFGFLTLLVFAGEIALSIYVLVFLPPSATTLTAFAVYVLIGLVPFGLACTMFTLATMMSRAV